MAGNEGAEKAARASEGRASPDTGREIDTRSSTGSEPRHVSGSEVDNGLGSTATAEEEGLTWQFYDLDFSVEKSRRYHEKLCAFYTGWREAVKIVTIVSGSGAALLVFLATPVVGGAVAAFVALWAALDYVIAPDKMADKHCELRDQFTDLAILIKKSAITPETYGELAAARLRIERNEPPCKRLVDLQARNDECRARGFPPEDLVPLSPLQRRFGYFFTFGMARLEKWKAERQRAQAIAA